MSIVGDFIRRIIGVEQTQRNLTVAADTYIPYVNRSLFDNEPSLEVDSRNAMTLAAVWSCVRIITESVAMMDRKVVKRNRDGSYDEIEDHPLLWNLNKRPNQRYSAPILTQTELKDVCLDGNSFTHLSFDSRGVVSSQTHIPFEDIYKCDIKPDGSLWWHTKYGTFPDDRIKHYKIMPTDGIWGMSPIAWHKDMLKTVKEAERYGKEFFEEGAFPSGVLSVPNLLERETREYVKSEIRKLQPGETLVLDGGTQYTPMSSVPADIQWLQTLDDMAKWLSAIYRVPLYMIDMKVEKPGYNSLEQLSLDFKQNTIKPYARMMEAEDTYKLLSTEEQMAGYEIQFNYDTLDLAGVEVLGEFITKMITQGVFTINEVRTKYFQKSKVPYGDEILVQGNNMTTLEKAVKDEGPIRSAFEQNQEEE